MEEFLFALVEGRAGRRRNALPGLKRRKEGRCTPSS